MTNTLSRTEHNIYRKDGKVYLYAVGSGEPLVFLHGVGNSGWTWRKVIDEFAQHFTCYVIDMPGFEHSDIPPRKYSMDDYTQAVVDVIDAIGLEQVNIIGDHTGSMIAVILAGQYPERVKKLVLDGLPYWNKERGQVLWEKWFLPMYTDTTSYHLPVSPLTTWEEAKASNPKLEREVWEKTDEIYRRSRLWIRLSQEANSSYDMEAAGPDVKAPTLIVYGDGDALRRGEKYANEGIKGSIVKVVTDSEGPAHEFQPHEFASVSIEFLKN